MAKDKLNELLAAATAERDALIAQANQQIAYLNGRIAALEELATDDPAQATPAAVEGNGHAPLAHEMAG